jgi:hypothetical protein
VTAVAYPSPKHPEPIEDTDVHYGPATRPQGPLPFSIWVRRKYRWWPGSERYGGLVDRIIIALILAPGVIWAILSFGWIPGLFVLAELALVFEIIYRIATGTMLGD